MKKHFVLAILSLSAFILHAQTTRSFLDDARAPQRDHPLDFTHLQLQLSLDPAAGRVRGEATHFFTPLRPIVDSFFLDAVQMTIHAITLNGQPVRYHSDSAGITIVPSKPLQWGHQDSLTIQYEASPRRGLYFIGWNDPLNGSRKQVWSQGEGIDNRFWIPMYDERNDKLTTELIVTFDKAYKVLSNGQLLDKKENADGTDTWHYRISHSHAPYLTMLGIGKYDIKETHTPSGTPLHLYYYPEWTDRVEPTYQYSEAIIDFFEQEIGIKYPWETYSQIPVQDYMFGAMENTTATIFGDFYMVDRRGALDRTYVAVNAHEAAHQWFGDYVTARSDAHQWLQESFATYYDQLFERSVYGEEHFDWLRRGAENGAISESTHNRAGVGSSMAGGAQIYGKGAFVLNMLKSVVGGREPYNKAIKYYLTQHPYQNVDSHDLLTAFEESTGMDLDWFWDQWIYRGEEPAYLVTCKEYEASTELVVRQTQELTDVKGYKKGLFKMPVPIEIHYADHSVYRQTHWIAQQTEILQIPNPDHKKIAYVLFDPGNVLLRTLNFPRSFDWLQAQAQEAEHLLDRYDALVAMKKFPLDLRRPILLNIFHKEHFQALRTEVLAQLSSDSSASSFALFQEALRDPDVAVRRAALASAPALVLPYCEKLLGDSSYGIIETALQKLAAAFPSRIPQYLKTTRGIEGNLGRNVQIKWLELSYASTAKAYYADQLVSLTSGSYEFRARTNAMAALKRSAYFSPALLPNLVDAILSSNGRLSAPAFDLLRWYFAQNKYRAPISNYIRSGHWATREMVVLGEFVN